MNEYKKEPCKGFKPSQGLILTKATVTDGHSFLIEDGAIKMENGKFTFIGKSSELPVDSSETIDLHSRLVLPGLLNPHHHLYSALATGLAPIGATNNFTQILENLWWHLDKTLDEESVYYSAINGLIQSVRYGVTTVFDHHASMNAVKGSLAIIEKAFRGIGVKGLLCYEISDRMGENHLAEQIEENIDFWKNHRNDKHIHGMLGLHANFTLSEKTMTRLQKEKPADMPIHIHCGEDRADWQYCVDHGYAGPADRLNEFGLLTEDSFLAHCIHLSEKDYELIDNIQPVVISNPESNANNNVGAMNLSKIKNYILGTDGMTGNVLGTMRSHFLFRNGKIENPLKILFQRPAEVIQRFFTGAGTLRNGFNADIAVTDYIPVTPISLDNLFYHLLFGVQGREMYMTIADGRILFANNEMHNISETETILKVKEAAVRLHRKYYE